MATYRLLLVCSLFHLGCFQSVQYTPREVNRCGGDDLPINIHSLVKVRIEEIELESNSGGIAELTANIESLNTSVQLQGSLYKELLTDVRSLKTTVDGLLQINTTSVQQTTEPPTTNEPTTSDHDPAPPRGSFVNPASSCKEIPQGSPSGEYWIQNSQQTVSIQVYCDMTRNCCSITGGWTRVANLDMTDPSQECPSGFRLVNRTTAPLRTCGRPGPPGCASTLFTIPEATYTNVCGRIIGYQYGRGGAFSRGLTILTGYLIGVSLTHGDSPKQHIWSFAQAEDEVSSNTADICPCTRPELTHVGTIPSFVEQDYFCDTGSQNTAVSSTFYDMDPLWDGQGCGGTSTCCSFNNPPWFCKQLPQPTTDDIELRLCSSGSTPFSDIPLEIVELYVR